MAVTGRYQLPAALRGNLENQPRQRFFRSTSGKQHAAIQENPHALPAFRQIASASISSATIQLCRISSGISRTGTASAGCRKIPPSLSSTSIIGCCAASSPSLRRISGGKVIVPRFDIGMLVMQQYCNAAMRVSITKSQSIVAIPGQNSKQFRGATPAGPVEDFHAGRHPRVRTAQESPTHPSNPTP